MPEATVEDTSSVEVLKERIKELEEELANDQPTPEDDSCSIAVPNTVTAIEASQGPYETLT